MQKICIINQKGGAGKTSFSILAAMAIASKDYKVLVVDCDPQAGLTNYLSPSEDVRLGIFDILLGRNDFNIVNVTRHDITFDLIPADHRLDKIYATLDPFAFEPVFEESTYDFIIFDTPPTVQGISRAAALVSDKIFIPADLSRGTIRPTLYTIEALKQIKKKGSVIFIGYKDPKDESKSFMSELSRDFMDKVKNSYAGTIAKNITMQKLVSDESYKWTVKKKEEVLNPILEIMGIK